MENVLKASNISYRYTKQYCIKDFSISVMKGEIVSIIGPNGSGKSTVLRMLSRLLKPEEGVVFIEGENIKGMKGNAIAQKMTMLPQVQDHHLDMTVRDLIKNGRRPYLKWYEDYNSGHDKYVDWALDITNVTHLQHRPLYALSGGERQRAWIAMSITQTPEILLLDEPTSYLDISHQLEVLDLLTELNSALGITIIMVLHDLNQAAKYSHRLIAMKNGKVVREGKPVDVYDSEFFREVFSVEAKVYIEGEKPVFSPHGVVKRNNRKVDGSVY